MLTPEPKMILCLFVLTKVICFKKIYSPNLINQQRITAWFLEFTHKGMAQTRSKLNTQKLYKGLCPHYAKLIMFSLYKHSSNCLSLLVVVKHGGYSCTHAHKNIRRCFRIMWRIPAMRLLSMQLKTDLDVDFRSSQARYLRHTQCKLNHSKLLH